MSGFLDCHGITDTGKMRENNEDQFLIADLQRAMRVHQTSLGLDHQTRLFGGSQGKLFLVADGMGGHAAGERASSLAVDCVTEYLLNTTHCLFRAHDESSDEDEFCEDLKAAFHHCQKKFTTEIEAMPNREGMGTTLTMAYVVWPRLYVVHVGDTRAYLLRNSHFEQITSDHTLAQAYVDRNDMSQSEADQSVFSHVLINAIGGGSEDVNPEISKTQLEIGDKLLVCSDGLTGLVSDDNLFRMLREEQTSEEICRRLVDAANEAGGTDNITVIVAQFQDVDGEESVFYEEADLPADDTRSTRDTAPFLKGTKTDAVQGS